MSTIEFEDGAIQVDAAIVGEGLGIAPALVQGRMREGKITSLCERGINKDNGRYRLTFFSESKRFRLIIDESGNVVQRSVLTFTDRPLPRWARKPAA